MLMNYVKKKRERKDAYPKKVCHMLAKACQKKRRENVDSPQLEMTKEKKACKKEFIHESPKIVHTLAHLDQVV